MSLSNVLQRLKHEWAIPRVAIHAGRPTMLRLSCSVSDQPAIADQDRVLPPSLAEFWQHTESARLFEDKQYGQWGLVLFSPTRAIERSSRLFEDRPREYRNGDMVVGEFLGDSDLLIVRSDPDASDFGTVTVALPLDSRDGWYFLSMDLEGFILEYERAHGAKFWEQLATEGSD